MPQQFDLLKASAVTQIADDLRDDVTDIISGEGIFDQPLSSYQAFLEADIPAPVVRVSFLSQGQSYSLVRDSSGPVEQTNGDKWRPDGFVVVTAFGVTPYATYEAALAGADQVPGIQAAVDYAGSQDLRRVFFPSGNYTFGSMLNCNSDGINLDADPRTRFVGTGTGYPLVWAQRSSFRISCNIILRASDARKASGSKLDMGLLMEPAHDRALIIEMDARGLRVMDQGGTGIACNRCTTFYLEDTYVSGSGRHNTVIGNLTETADFFGANSAARASDTPFYTGMGNISGRSTGHKGHSLIVGDPEFEPYHLNFRVKVQNYDHGSDDKDEGILIEPVDMILYGDNCSYVGGDLGGNFPITGMVLAGRDSFVGGDIRGFVGEDLITFKEYLGRSSRSLSVGRFLLIGASPNGIINNDANIPQCRIENTGYDIYQLTGTPQNFSNIIARDGTVTRGYAHVQPGLRSDVYLLQTDSTVDIDIGNGSNVNSCLISFSTNITADPQGIVRARLRSTPAVSAIAVENSGQLVLSTDDTLTPATATANRITFVALDNGKLRVINTNSAERRYTFSVLNVDLIGSQHEWTHINVPTAE